MGLVPHGLEGGKAAADHVIRDAVADPEVFLAAKAGAGDDEEVLFLRQVREDLISKSGDDMMKVRNMGRKSLEEVQNKLAMMGLSLASDDSTNNNN